MELPPHEVMDELIGDNTQKQCASTLDRMVERYRRDPEVMSDIERAKVKPREPGDSENMLQQFLNDIGQYSIPNEEEQKALAYSIRRGVNAQLELDKDPSRVDLIPDIKSAVSARQKMILRNAKLVVSWANKICTNNDNYSKLDRIEEGMMGLARAVTKFDPDRGFKFSTYASWWIRQAIQRGRPNHELINLPAHEMDRRASLVLVKDGLERVLMRQPTAEELLAEFNLLHANGQQSKAMDMSELTKLLNLSKGTVSLNDKVDFKDADGAELGDIIDDKTKPPLFSDQTEHFEQTDELNSLLTRADLSVFDRLIISLRYGFLLIKPDESLAKVPDEYSDLVGRNFMAPEYQKVIAAIEDSQRGIVSMARCAQLTGIRSHNISLIENRIINKIRAYNSLAA